ncbi:MAG: c-type cytochrome domain-containing protein [Blastocatellia bacterium]
MKIRKQQRRWALCLIAVSISAFPAFGAKAGLMRQPAQTRTLSQQAGAILRQNCTGCHGAARTSELDLRTAEGILAGGENGKVITPGDPQASRLFQFVTHQEKPAMPPGKKTRRRGY